MQEITLAIIPSIIPMADEAPLLAACNKVASSLQNKLFLTLKLVFI